MLTISNLTVSYGSRVVLENLSLTLGAGSIHGLVGLNGAGKTTLLNALYGIKKPDRGELLYNGAPLKRSSMSFLETENFFYSNITGNEYLSLFRSPNADYSATRWNELFTLPLDELIDGYSTGMKKRLALMATLKQDREILILDEPFNGLDIEASKLLSLLVVKLRDKGRTIIITSHILESLINICTHIHYIANGSIAFTREAENFAGIENEIFGAMETRNNELIDGVV